MKQFALSLLLVCPFFLGFFQPSAHAGTTDYALMSASPYNSEIALARGRLEKFLYKANAKKRAILAQTPVVAVQAAVLAATETGPFYAGYKGVNMVVATEEQPIRLIASFFSCFSSTAAQDNWCPTMEFWF